MGLLWNRQPHLVYQRINFLLGSLNHNWIILPCPQINNQKIFRFTASWMISRMSLWLWIESALISAAQNFNFSHTIVYQFLNFWCWLGFLNSNPYWAQVFWSVTRQLKVFKYLLAESKFLGGFLWPLLIPIIRLTMSHENYTNFLFRCIPNILWHAGWTYCAGFWNHTMNLCMK